MGRINGIEDIEDEILLEALNNPIWFYDLYARKKIILFRNLTWITSLLRASYAFLLKDAGYTYESIAEELGLTKATVQRMLTADPDAVVKKIKGELSGDEIDEHIAGGLAKLAYKAVRTRLVEDEIRSVSKTAEVLGVEWAVKTLQHIKGLDFPVEKAELQSRLRDLYVFNIPMKNILEELKYPITSPAILIKQIAEVLREKGIHPSKG